MQVQKTVIVSRPFTIEILKARGIVGYVLTVQNFQIYETERAGFLEALKELRGALDQLLEQFAGEKDGGS